MFPSLFAQLERNQRDGRIYGLCFGEVTQLGDDGPMVLLHSTEISEPVGPARIATMMAGDRRGTFFRPEVGDEVVVGFELGDPGRPVILGGLWNDQASPPSQADTSASNDRRTIVSRAGHELTFDDSSGGSKVTIKSSGGFEITIQDAPTPRITIKTTGVVASSKIELDGIAWNHQHATGVGLSGPPLSITPVP